MTTQSLKKAVIFDMDGVLVFTEHIRFDVIKNIFVKRGLDFSSHTVKSFMGRTTRDILHLLIDDVIKVEEMFEEYQLTKPKNIADYAKPIETTVNFLKEYNGPLPLAIASNSPKHVIEAALKHLAIKEKFSVLISKDDVSHPKPNPAIYLKTASELNLKPNECIVIEDSIIGAEAATKAGTQCYILLHEYNSKEEFFELPISGFIKTTKDLENLVNK